MIVNVVINTNKYLDLNKLQDRIYKEFGKEAAICCPYINISIEGRAPIREEHRLYCSLEYSDVVIFVSTIYCDATPINRLIRSIELISLTNVYNWAVKEINDG